MSTIKRTHPWRVPYSGAPIKAQPSSHLPNRQFRILPR